MRSPGEWVRRLFADPGSAKSSKPEALKAAQQDNGEEPPHRAMALSRWRPSGWCGAITHAASCARKHGIFASHANESIWEAPMAPARPSQERLLRKDVPSYTGKSTPVGTNRARAEYLA